MKKNILSILSLVILLIVVYVFAYNNGKESIEEARYEGDGTQYVDVLIHENSGWSRAYYGDMKEVIVYEDGSVCIEMENAWLVGEAKEE